MSEELSVQNQDISRIVTLLTENPSLVEEIKSLIEKSAKEDAPASASPAIEDTVTLAPDAPDENIGHGKGRRGQLLCALKPYVSKERARAIDTMMTFSQILDMMKER
ncbi:MAG: hypothetical protein IJY65_03930 [Clostridia bacterium]|nr:hypothetical protein [Clostridia bacterium]